eukprot:PhM_4_TR789/c0_g3_i1/m.35596
MYPSGGYPMQPYTGHRGVMAVPQPGYGYGYGYSYPYAYGNPYPPQNQTYRRPRVDRQAQAQMLCCYFLQGICKFDDKCRYSHEDKGQPCNFGNKCRLEHYNRKEGEKAPEQIENAEEKQDVEQENKTD